MPSLHYWLLKRQTDPVKKIKKNSLLSFNFILCVVVHSLFYLSQFFIISRWWLRLIGEFFDIFVDSTSFLICDTPLERLSTAAASPKITMTSAAASMSWEGGFTFCARVMFSIDLTGAWRSRSLLRLSFTKLKLPTRLCCRYLVSCLYLLLAPAWYDYIWCLLPNLTQQRVR